MGLLLRPSASVCYGSTLWEQGIWKASNTRWYSKTSYLGIFAMAEIPSWSLISTHGRLSVNIWQRQQNLERLQRLNLAFCLGYLARSLTDPMTCFTRVAVAVWKQPLREVMGDWLGSSISFISPEINFEEAIQHCLRIRLCIRNSHSFSCLV